MIEEKKLELHYASDDAVSFYDSGITRVGSKFQPKMEDWDT